MVAPAFLSELALPGPKLDLWVEIEGLPYGFGLTARASSWFAARHYEFRRDGILGLLLDLPAGVEQEVEPFEAHSSIGQLTASVIDDPNGVVRAMYANIARTDGWGRLGQDLAAPAASSATPATADVTMTAPAGTQVGDLLYVGRETMRVAALPGGGVVTVYRGVFRPTAPIERQAYTHTTGDIVTRYPRFLATRRAYFYAAPLGGTDADKVARWAGTVRGVKMRRGLAAVDITIESVESDLRVKCFEGQVRGKLVVGVRGADGTYEAEDGEPAPLTNRLRLEPSSLSGRAWVDGERIVFRLGDEIITGRLQANATYPNEIHFDDPATYPEDARGLFATAALPHAIGDEVVEVLPVIGKNANGSVEERVSRFSQGDNPLDVALQFLLSDTGDGSNGTFDVLPDGWGRKIDASRVDAAGIRALRDRWLPVAREVRIISEPFVMKELLADILRAHLCYPVTLLDDVLTFRFLGPPMPDATLRAVTAADIIGTPEWSGEIERVVGRSVLRCDYDPIEEEYRQTFKGEFQGPGTEAQEFYAGLFETVELEARGQWSGNDPGAAKFGARLTTDAETTALRHFDLVRDRRARPFPKIGLECHYDALDITPGDLLAVTVDGLPDVMTGAVGLSAAVCEARRRAVDDRGGRVGLTIVQTAHGRQHRLVAPSAIVATGATASSLALTAHVFTDSAGAEDGASFPVGAKVSVWSADLGTLRASGRVVTGYAAGALSFTGGNVTATAGDVVLLDDYSTQPAAVKALFAFLADNSNPPLLGADPAHEFTP